jgi:hypothetical protein
MTNTIKLTDKEAQVLTSIYKLTLSQSGYVDGISKEGDLDDLMENAQAYIDALDISIMPATSDMSMKSIGGVLTSLQSKGLIFADECVESIQQHKGLMQFGIQPSGIEVVFYNIHYSSEMEVPVRWGDK